MRDRSKGGKKPIAEIGALRKQFQYCLTVAFMIICLLGGGAAEATKHKRKVLVLNSYHNGYIWSDEIMKAVRAEFNKSGLNVELCIEYMDTRRHWRPDTVFPLLKELYQTKYQSQQPDVIISSDNCALAFILANRDSVFPGVPVVFCGVHGFSDFVLKGWDNLIRGEARELKNHKGITGVLEEYDYESTFRIALKLHRSARQIVVIDEKSPDSYGYWARIKSAVSKQDREVKLIVFSLSELSMAELLSKVEELGEESIVLLVCAFRDIEGDEYSLEESAKMISERCAAPMYAVDSRWVGLGALGGRTTCASHQGQAAAGMAIRILNGESAGNIPVLSESPNEYMFDYVQLKHFGILPSELPEGSIIINEPESFYYRYKWRIWAVIGLVTGLTAIISILLANILLRKKAEEAMWEYRELFSAFMDQLPATAFMKDEKCRMKYVNPYMIKVFSSDKWIGQTAAEYFPPEIAEGVLAHDSRTLSEGPSSREEWVPDRNGRMRCMQTYKFPIHREGKPPLIGGVAIDITERKGADEKLIDYQAQLKSLASQLILAEERERRRIAMELHDRISQTLAICKLELDALRASASCKSFPQALDEVSDSLGKAIADTRSLTFDLSFPLLYELGFEAAVAAWLTEQIEKKYGIATEFKEDKEHKPLDDDVRVLLFRSVQELLINAVKHSQAKKVTVSVRKVGDRIYVSVEDNGVGFNVKEAAGTVGKTGGFGLFSIRERLEELDGHFEIESEPGKGTKVILMAPLKQSDIKHKQG